MRNTLINKFKIFAMLSAFVIIFSSCDDSTSPSEENSALKKEIVGKWEIYTTLLEQNQMKEFSDDYYEIGHKDTTMWIIAFSNTNENIITIDNGNFDLIGEWMTTTSNKAPHWVVEFSGIHSYTNIKNLMNLEITAVNPLRGIMMYSIEDSLTKEHKLVQKFEITGKKLPNQIAQ